MSSAPTNPCAHTPRHGSLTPDSETVGESGQKNGRNDSLGEHDFRKVVKWRNEKKATRPEGLENESGGESHSG